MERTNNTVRLCGTIEEKPRFSHESRGENYYVFPLTAERLSGTADTVNVILREQSAAELIGRHAARVKIAGELRSFNNKSRDGSRLVITVFAKQLFYTEEADVNAVELTGTVCKEPNFRYTPMGRQICDIMLAVNRPYGRSDYLPCIAWGKMAEKAGKLRVGENIHIAGRIQSRTYIKTDDLGSHEKTAFEVSVTSFREIEHDTPESYDI